MDGPYVPLTCSHHCVLILILIVAFLKEFSQLWAFGMFLKEKQNVYIADNSSKLAANT